MTPMPFDPANFFPRLFRASRRSGCGIHVVARSGGWPITEITRFCPDQPLLYLSSGIHGDEPAGPLAILAILESGELSYQEVSLAIYPALNPAGLQAGTREGPEGLDYNRCYHDQSSACPLPVARHRTAVERIPKTSPITAALCLHEDWESTGGYLYELNPDQQASASPAILKAFGETCGVESAEIIDGWPTRGPGLIRTPDNPAERPVWPEAIYLIATQTRYCLTTETPSALPLDLRVAAQTEAIRTVLAHIQSHPPS